MPFKMVPGVTLTDHFRIVTIAVSTPKQEAQQWN